MSSRQRAAIESAIPAGYASVDLGASSGRVAVIGFDDSRLSFREVHRFGNAPVRRDQTLYWDALGIWREIGAGLRQAAASAQVASIGVDGWGVDFALLDSAGRLLADPVSYRDARTRGMFDKAFRLVGRDEIFDLTGTQFLELNTLYQLLSMKLTGSTDLDRARRLLMLPDLFRYWLSGDQSAEYTVATTTQLFDIRTSDWAWSLIERLGLPSAILPEIAPTGSDRGDISQSQMDEPGLRSARIIATASHDTASAVAAIPLGSGSAYISLGTWSLVGVEIPEPRVDRAVLAAGFTNEGGAGGRVRLLRNAAGLWMLEQCRRQWKLEGTPLDYDDIAALAGERLVPDSFVDVDSVEYLNPPDMREAIRGECASTGQRVPETRADLVRCILGSLALKFRVIIGKLEAILGREIDSIHVVGGGSRNAVLCQMTADATGKCVIAGPTEATAIGNALVQMLALGHIGSLTDGRELVRRSFEQVVYEPRPGDDWHEAYARFVSLFGDD